MLRSALAVALAALSIAIARPAEPSTLAVPSHRDFHDYTLALTWQPGICSAPGGLPKPVVPSSEICTHDQPHVPLIGLHGLWASLPRSLEMKHVPIEEWWARG